MSTIIALEGLHGFIRYTTTPFLTIQASSRGAVREFSAKSAGRIRRYLRTCVSDYAFIGTLTYPAEFPTDGKEFKRHLKNFIQRYTRQAESTARLDEQFSFFWFMEFQERGAVHFHFFTTHMPYQYPHQIPESDGIVNRELIKESRKWIARVWYECCGRIDPKHLLAGTQFDRMRTGRGGTIKYATKYALKQKQKQCPENVTNPGRWWGVSGDRSTVSASVVVTDRSLRRRDTTEAIMKFQSWMLTYEKSGLIDVHRDSTGMIRGFYCKTQKGYTRMRSRMFGLEAAILTGKISRMEIDMYDQEPGDILDPDYDDG